MPISDWRIESGLDTDGPALADLLRAVFAEYEGCLFLLEEFPELAAPASHFAAKSGALWVARRKGGGLFGSIAVAATHRPGVFELFKLYVSGDARGSGLAPALLNHIVAFVRENGGDAIVLWSDTRFLAGHRFYERNGFSRMPGLRALHDVSNTLEFGFRRSLGAHS